MSNNNSTSATQPTTPLPSAGTARSILNTGTTTQTVPNQPAAPQTTGVATPFGAILARARNDDAATSNSTYIPRTERARLNPDKLALVGAEASRGETDAPFTLLALSLGGNDSVMIDDCHQLSTQLTTAHRHCAHYDMHKIFTHFPRLDFTQPSSLNYFDAGKTINLFTEFDLIEPEEIARATRWIRTHLADEELLTDMTWSENYFVTSCDGATDGLRQATVQDIEEYRSKDPLSVGGPLALRLILARITSSDEEALVLLSEKLEHFSIANVPGEDIELVCRQLKKYFQRLEATKNLPKFLNRKLARTFCTSSTTEFNEVFRQLQRELHMDPVKYTWTQVMDTAIRIYRQFMSTNEWQTGKAQNQGKGSVFTADDSGRKKDFNPNKQSTGKENKRWNKDKKVPSPEEKAKKLWFTSPNKENGDVLCQTDPKRWKRTIDGKTCHWCGKCNNGKGRWTHSKFLHFTDEHGTNRPAHGNVAASTSATESTGIEGALTRIN